MKKCSYYSVRPVIFIILVFSLFSCGSFSQMGGSNEAKQQARAVGVGTTSEEVRSIIIKANDFWQSSNPNPGDAFWNRAAYHTGNIAAWKLTGATNYLEYSLNWAERNRWMGATSNDKSNWRYEHYGEGMDFVLFADWQICFQTYIDLYNIEPDEKKIARAKDVMSYQIETDTIDYLWWSDGLYMLMPIMTKMYKHTGDERYLSKLYDYFAFAKELMYDDEYNLFYRDAKYIYPKHKTANGMKDFWSRGNGWVFAAIPKVLEDLPKTDKYRKEYVAVFQKMAQSLALAQNEEGYWSRSIIDDGHAPGRETSGTAFFAYGFLWGINNGLLDEALYLPVVKKAWSYLSETALQPNGKVGYVQPIGERADQHKNVGPETTADFGVGAFLLAASEMVRYLEL